MYPKPFFKNGEWGRRSKMDEKIEKELCEAQLKMVRNKLVLRESQCDYLRMRMARHERRIKELNRVLSRGNVQCVVKVLNK